MVGCSSHSLVHPTGQIAVFAGHLVIGHNAAAHLVGNEDHDFTAGTGRRQQLIDLAINVFTAPQKVDFCGVRRIFAIE